MSGAEEEMQTEGDEEIGGGGRTSKLYRTIHKGLPEYRNEEHAGLLNVKKLTDALDISTQSFYLWTASGRLPPKRVGELIRLPGSTLTKEVLIPFVVGL